MSDLLVRLRGRGWRLTAQRRVVAEVLDGDHVHLTADEVHARAAALVQEHSDIVLFANYRVSTVKADVGFNKKVSRAVGSGERVIHTTERPAFLAKNRYGLPDTLPLDWQALAQAMPEAIRPLLMTAPVATPHTV